ncbi:SHOCT domain-containing protein [Halobellus rufus]|uniref:SHOCT domain-containing protein n=1 Tax=Halobellus rufus TaxID=1448860 RepID=UPI000679883B|nr:SHOCT domain-containing protein [Halobellus rufus]
MGRQPATRWLVGALIALAVLLFVWPLLFGMGGGMMGWGGTTGGMWGPMHDGWMGGTDAGSTWWWLLAFLWRLLFLLVIVGAGYLLYRAVSDGESSDPALDELRSAYARGDLSEEEFERRRERLEE